MDPTPSIFAPFFVCKEGVISLNLRSINIVTSASIFVYIFAAVYQTCTDGTFVCDETHFPWISDFIKLPLYDRVFCILTMVHSFTSMLGVIRSFWKIQHDIGTSDLYNGIAALFGCISVVALPGDALCDGDNFGRWHHYMALSFFVGTLIYALMLTTNLVCNYSKFNTEDQSVIQKMCMVIGLILCLGAFDMYLKIYHIKWNLLGPFVEWVGTVLVIAFYIVASFVNHKFDSVALVEAKPIKKITP